MFVDITDNAVSHKLGFRLIALQFKKGRQRFVNFLSKWVFNGQESRPIFIILEEGYTFANVCEGERA